MLNALSVSSALQIRLTSEHMLYTAPAANVSFSGRMPKAAKDVQVRSTHKGHIMKHDLISHDLRRGWQISLGAICDAAVTKCPADKQVTMDGAGYSIPA